MTTKVLNKNICNDYEKLDAELLEPVLSYYANGKSIDSIANKLNISREKVLITLRKYKDSQRPNGTYSDDFLKLVADRDSSGVMKVNIMNELLISRSPLMRAIEEFGFVTSRKKEDDYEFIRGVNPLDKIEECPFCGNTKLNDVDSIITRNSVDFEVEGKYCMGCGEETFIFKNVLYKTKWENVD